MEAPFIHDTLRPFSTHSRQAVAAAWDRALYFAWRHSSVLWRNKTSAPGRCVPYESPALTVESTEPSLRNTFVLTSMRSPSPFRRLYRLHLSAQHSITIIMKPTTIRLNGRVEALLITHTWSRRRSHPMSIRSVPSNRHGDGGLDQVGLNCYKEGRYR